MKIALTTIGSRGDIQPYIALGCALQEFGYTVTVVTHPWAKGLLQSYNLQHVPVGSDIDIHATAKRFNENATGTIKGLQFALNFIFIQLRECHQGLMDVLEDFDLVVGHGIVGSAEADILKKPFVSVSIETMGLQKEYWKSKNLLKELGIYFGDQMKGLLFGGPYQKYRKEVGAPPINAKRNFPHLAIVPISSHIQSSNPNWKPVTQITGYFIADIPDSFSPPTDLMKFIEGGEKPIFICFGSMFHKSEQTLQLFHTLADAIKGSNSRAILLMADLKTEDVKIPEYIFPVKNISYRWLLQHVSLVVHHFGFGTTAEVLSTGLPSIPIPHIFDQGIRANQMHKLGLTHKPLNLKTINSEKLSAAINKVKSDAQLISRCKEIGTKITMENGLANAIELINSYYGM